MSEEEVTQDIQVVQNENNGTSVSIDASSILNPEPPVEEPEVVVPDKFKAEDGSINTEALLKSYLELEKVGGEPVPDTPAEEPQEEPQADFDLQPYYDKFTSGEEITEEDINTISGGMKIAPDLVKRYIDLNTQDIKATLEDANNRIYNVVGGKDRYDDMISWANDNLSTEQVTAVNAQMDNPVFAEQGATLLKSLYEQANGKEPQVTATPSAVSAQDFDPAGEFYSIAEVREAQRGAKYRAGDPRTHAEFDAKLARFKARQNS